jgi:hypothetical protein
MIQFSYNFCLLYILFIIISQIDMSIIDMQIDDTLILADQSFVVVENKAIILAKIMIKTRDQLIMNNLLKFNDTKIQRFDSNESIYYRQETHIQDIQLMQSIESIIISARDKMCIKLIYRKQYMI